jgi:hypothetical protein
MSNAPTPDLSGLGNLLQSIAAQNTNMFPQLSSLPAGLTGANIKNAFTPEVLFASGMMGGQSFQPMIDSIYNEMVADYNRQVEKLTALPWEATFQSLDFNADPVYAQGTEIGELFRDAVDGITAGNLTAAQALQNINNAISSGAVPEETAQYIGKIGDDLATFEERDLPSYRNAVRKHEYTSTQALESAGITAPTQQDARLKFFKDMGAPELALLPDPSERYKVDPELFMDKKVLSKIRSQQERAAKTIADEESRLGKELSRQGGWGARTRRLGGLLGGADKARIAAENKYMEENAPKDTRDFLTKGMDWAGSAPIIGGLFGGNSRAKQMAPVRDAAKAAGKTAQEEYLRSNAQKQLAGPTVYDLSPAALKAKQQQLAANAAMNILSRGAAPKVERTQRMLESVGLTPYQQAMNQMIANAVAMQTKIK